MELPARSYEVLPDPASKVAVLVKQFAGVGILDTNQYTTIETLLGTHPLVLVNNFPKDESLISELYPNPSTGIINIRIKSLSYSVIELTISDLSGRVLDHIQDFIGSSGELIFNYNSGKFPAGVYLCIIRSSGTLNVKQMIVL